MDASPVPDAGAVPRLSRYRVTLLPRPDLVARDAKPVLDRYRRTALCGDAAVAVAACLATSLMVFGVQVPSVYWAVTTALPVLWLALLALLHAYDAEVLGAARLERHSIARAAVVLVVTAGTCAYLVGAHLSRSYVVVSAAAAVLGSLAVRRVLRRRLHRMRRRGRGLRRALVVGHAERAARAIERLDSGQEHGYAAVAACLPSDGVRVSPPHGIPVAADVGEVLALAGEFDVDAVVLASDLDISGLAARRLAEGLAPRSIALLVAAETAAAAWAPSATAVPGLPLVRVRPGVAPIV